MSFVPITLCLAGVLLTGVLGGFLHRRAAARTFDIEARARRESATGDAPVPSCPDRPGSPKGMDGPEGLDGIDGIDGIDGQDRHDHANVDGERVEEQRANHPLVATFLDVGGPVRLDIPDIPVARADLEIALDARGVATLADNLVPPPIAAGAIDRAEHEIALGSAADANGALRLALRDEKALREETGKHLRIVRKALSKLEGRSRHREGERAETLVALEEELESRLHEGARAESAASRESARRLDAEQRIAVLEKHVLAARQDARRDAASRARTLSVANRSIALTRRAVEARTRLEGQVEALETTLSERDEALDTLARALDREKGRTRENVVALARQLVMHERQLRARGNPDAPSPDAEDKLTTRLARKTARARTLDTDRPAPLRP